MFVPAEIKARIASVIAEGLGKANKRYNLNMPMPTITYNQGGARVAGTASYRKWVIDLNPAILMNNIEEFIADTPLHELGHLVCDRVYPEAHQSNIAFSYTAGRYKRTKRDVHGARWQECTRACGHPNPTRCHSFDTVELKVKAGGGQWECTCGCGKKATVGAKIHQQLLADPSSRRFHRGYPLRQVGVTTAPVIVKTDVSVGVTTVKKVADPFANITVVKSQDVATGSKLDQCWAIYKRNVGSSRGAIIQTMISMAGCTPAGASTYYQQCKKRYEAGVL